MIKAVTTIPQKTIVLVVIEPLTKYSNLSPVAASFGARLRAPLQLAADLSFSLRNFCTMPVLGRSNVNSGENSCMN